MLGHRSRWTWVIPHPSLSCRLGEYRVSRIQRYWYPSRRVRSMALTNVFGKMTWGRFLPRSSQCLNWSTLWTRRHPSSYWETGNCPLLHWKCRVLGAASDHWEPRWFSWPTVLALAVAGIIHQPHLSSDELSGIVRFLSISGSSGPARQSILALKIPTTQHCKTHQCNPHQCRNQTPNHHWCNSYNRVHPAS